MPSCASTIDRTRSYPGIAETPRGKASFEVDESLLAGVTIARENMVIQELMRIVNSLRSRWADANMPRYVVLAAFLLLCMLGGGSSRADVPSLLYLRPAAVLAIALLAVLPGQWDFTAVRTPLLFLAALALLIALQLVPLPPAIWTTLPGHGRFAVIADLVGKPQPWRPITLSPDDTFNSLLALLPALVVLIGLAGLGKRERESLVLVPVVIAVASAVLAVGQLGGGNDSPLQLYRLSNLGGANGFFANRNHEATLLALALPCLAVWAGRALDPATTQRRAMIALAIAILLAPMILVTGSRAGVVTGAAGFVLAVLLLVPARARLAPTPRARLIVIAAIVAPILLAGIVLVLGRAVAVDRLLSQSVTQGEQRLDMAPIVIGLVREYFPFGIGFGAFDPAFRIAEPDWALHRTYFNHAHDDLLEIVLTGGLTGALLLAVALGWGARRTGRLVVQALGTRGAAGLTGLAGVAIVLVLLMASLVDYPVRTPLLTAILALAIGLAGVPHKVSQRTSRARKA